jgi:hypothetical protein
MTNVVRVIDQFNFDWTTGLSRKCCEDESVTIPDQSYTIKELLDRHRQGQLTDVDIGRDPVYYDHDDYDDPDVEKLGTMDLVDKAEFVAEGRRVSKMIKDQEAKAKKAKDKEEFDSLVQSEARKLREADAPKAPVSGKPEASEGGAAGPGLSP